MKVAVIRGLKLNGAEFVSVVDKGASGDAENRPRIVLVKRKETVMGALSRWLKSSVKKQEEAGAPALKSPEELLMAALEGLPQEKIDMIMAAVTALAGAPAPTPAAEEPKQDDEGDETPKQDDEGDETPKQDDEGDETPKQDDEEDEMAKVLKKADPEVAAVLKKLTDDLVKAKKVADDATKSVGEMAADRRREALTKKAESELAFLPASTEDIVKILEAADESLDDKAGDAFVEMLQKTSKMIDRSGFFDEEGTARQRVGGNAEDELDQLAKARVKEIRKSGARITYAQAWSQVYKENNELRKQYKAEQRGGEA